MDDLFERERQLMAMRPTYAGEREKRARWYAKRHDFKGAPGGWIYKNHVPVAQGYIAFYGRYANRIEQARVDAGLAVLGERGAA